MNDLTDMIIKHEGMRKYPYMCTAGKITIGVGRNLDDKGITEEEALYLMNNDLNECRDDLNIIFDQFWKLPDYMKFVLIDMRFNLGPARFRKFKKMIQAVKDDDVEEMIVQMKDSKWYTQVTNRANDLIDLLAPLRSNNG